MSELSLFLEKWQTLIGAFLGGIFALSVALLVAYKVRRHDEISAAMLLTIDLVNVREAAAALDALTNTKNIPNEERPKWITDKLLMSRPILSPLFEASMVRVTAVDKLLAGHLAAFKIIYVDVDDMLKRLSREVERFAETGKSIMSKEELDIHLSLISKNLHLAAKHANCSINLLKKLIIRRTALFHRLIRHIRIPKSESECVKLLKDGIT